MKKSRVTSFFPGKRGLLDKLTGVHGAKDLDMTQDLKMNQFDRFYLSLADEDVRDSFSTLVFSYGIHSLHDMENMDKKKIDKLRNLAPIWKKEKLSNLSKKYKEFNFSELAKKHGRVGYEGKLKEHGVPIIPLQDITIVNRIGSGPYSGTVNEAVWTKPDGNKVKVCLRYERNVRQAHNFFHEAKMLMTVKHEHVISLHGVVVFGEYVDSIALVLELSPHGNVVEGLSLLTIRSFCNLLSQVASVLQHIANKGMIHFGLSDAAIFLVAKDKIKVSAFWGCHPQENIAAINHYELPWLGNSTIRNKADMVAWFAYFAERVFHLLHKRRHTTTFRKESAEHTYFSVFCPEVMYTLLGRCSSTTPPLGRPSFDEIVTFLNNKNFPPIVMMTSKFSAKNEGDLCFKEGDEILLISKNCTSKFHNPSEDVWFGENDDGKVGLFYSSYARPLFYEDSPSIKQPSVAENIEDQAKEDQLSAQVPAEITARGPEAEHAYRKALLEGKVQVYRGRIMLIGQDRAGKTSLKKSLLGMPFDPKEESTEGIEVDPSTFEVDVDQVKNWRKSSVKALVSEFADDIARIMVDELTQPKMKADEDCKMPLPDDPTLTESSAIEQQPGSEVTDTGATPDESDDSFSGEQTTPDTEIGQSFTPTPDSIQIEIHDNASVPEDVTNLVIQYLQNLELNEEYPSSHETVVSMWDFAGQHLYYASHPVFLSPRAVYVLVYNLSKDLDAVAQPCVRQGVYDVLLENPEQQTNLDGILSWLVSIHSIHCGDEGGTTQRRPPFQGDRETKDPISKALPYLRPPVIIVGTHRDIPFEDPKHMETHIKKSLAGKSYQQHVVKPFVMVTNTLSSADKGIQLLQKTIGDVLKLEPYMGEDVPVRWFNFEKVVDALVQRKTYQMSLVDLQRIINEVCFIDDDREVAAMLDFYHDLGVIVKHGGTVVLQAQWLIDLFRKLITIRPFDEQNPMFAEYWGELEESGILHMGLAEHVFTEIVNSGQSQEDILAMMEHYGLIARFRIDGGSDDKRYFVPAQLSTSPEGLLDSTPSPDDACALYIHFQDGFVPHGLYTMFVSKCISWCSSQGCRHEPNLYRGVSRFIIGIAADYELILVCRKSVIMVILQSISNEPTNSQSVSPAAAVRIFIIETLRDMTRDCLWLRNMRYELCVMCPSCLANPKPCYKHRLTSCKVDDCIHLLPIPDDKVLICRKSYGKGSRPVVKGLGDWYREVQDERASSSNVPVNVTTPGLVPHEQLMLLAREIGILWKGLGRALGLDEAELDQIEADESQLYEQSYRVLRRWTEVNASASTYESLGRALVHNTIQREDLAAKYCGDSWLQLKGAMAIEQDDNTDSPLVPVPIPSASPLPPVFLSYQWDLQDTALELGRRLRETGIDCWMDVGQMGGGDALYAEIDAGVRAAKVMLCCVTSRYCASENCQREVTLADSLRKPVIPLLFEFIPWPPAGQLGPIFAKLLYIDMTQGPDKLPQPKFKELTQKIHKYCASQ